MQVLIILTMSGHVHGIPSCFAFVAGHNSTSSDVRQVAGSAFTNSEAELEKLEQLIRAQCHPWPNFLSVTLICG